MGPSSKGRIFPFQGKNTGSSPVGPKKESAYPSGQRKWTVNPLAQVFVGSNPTAGIMIEVKDRIDNKISKSEAKI